MENKDLFIIHNQYYGVDDLVIQRAKASADYVLTQTLLKYTGFSTTGVKDQHFYGYELGY